MSSDTAHDDAFRIRDPRAPLPSAGAMLSALTHAQIDGSACDRELPERVKTSPY